MDAQNFVMLATADDYVGLASFEGMTAACQDAADSLGQTVTARDAVTDELIATYEPAQVTA